MFIECIDEVRVTHDDREHLFEERARFGYVYDVPDELGKAAVATGKCLEVKDFKGLAEIPLSTSVVEVQKIVPEGDEA